MFKTTAKPNNHPSLMLMRNNFIKPPLNTIRNIGFNRCDGHRTLRFLGKKLFDLDLFSTQLQVGWNKVKLNLIRFKKRGYLWKDKSASELWMDHLIKNVEIN
ncbi:hypothetical protein RF11_11169 [Thelohanellus kitauei]|uniref:Uncharacterized protein n=1 Tax=Thelohanellus kitauei TaxID=669202 RepID=A0A0C2MNG7_THEKT|nr:hypothetical protein RF11_11169 [Thelohanellus kitauei]